MGKYFIREEVLKYCKMCGMPIKKRVVCIPIDPEDNEPSERIYITDVKCRCSQEEKERS